MPDPDFDPSQLKKGRWWYFEINILALVRVIKRFLKRKKGE
jgi:hypothetical protein